uniref:YHS domain-containing (seleno)protein n=1 Tax=Flavobacterium sp. TaxID=239 RepID=UPI00404B7FE5
MKKFKTLLAVAIIALFSNAVTAQTQPVDASKLANGGYDVVSYFTANKATKGTKQFSATNNGATYYFASAKNQKAFKANPTKYLPQCDGYCAWGVAEKGTKFPVNPETFKIVDGKLYLFFNGDYEGKPFNTLTEWNKDESKLVKNMEKAWEKVKKS